MKTILNEFKKTNYIPFFLMSTIGIAIICFFSVGYVTENGKGISIFELAFFVGKENMKVDVNLNALNVWMQGLGVWVDFALPFFLGIGYIIVNSIEKKNGYLNFMLIRKNTTGIFIPKTLSAMMVGGINLLLGYVMFGIAVTIMFPSLNDFSANDISNFYIFLGSDNVWSIVADRCISVFLYGMTVNVFAVLLSSLFIDRYIITCMAILISYFYKSFISKLQYSGTGMNSSRINIESIFNTSNFLLAESYDIRLVRFLIFMMIYVIVGLIQSRITKKGVLLY